MISLSTSLDCLCRVLSVIGYQFAYWVTVGRADHSAVHHSVCVMPATGSTCQWASHCPVAQRDNDFATFWLPLPPVCQPFAIFYSHLFPSLSLSCMLSLALAHSFSSSFRRRRCCRRCRSQKSRGKIETKTFGCQRRKRATAKRIKRIKRMCVVIWATNWSRHNSVAASHIHIHTHT